MKTRCPCCGSTLSLDALVANEDARQCLIVVFGISGEFGSAVCRYLSLFRPRGRDLTFERVARLMQEIVDGVQAGTIERGGKTYPAPVEAWVWAMNKARDAHYAGNLTTPLKNHGYLFQTMTGWRDDTAGSVGAATCRPQPMPRPPSQTVSAIAVLEDRVSG